MSLVIGGLIVGGLTVAYKWLRGSRKISNDTSQPVTKEKVVEQSKEVTEPKNNNNKSPLQL